MTKNFLINPLSGDCIFGEIDALSLGGINTNRCSIYLFSGRHIGPNKGFGAKHIYAEHATEMKNIGLYNIADVPQYVCNIIKPGTSLYFEGGNWKHTRILAVKSSNGTAILEYINRRDGAIWSVVTAYSTPRRSGVAVGKII